MLLVFDIGNTHTVLGVFKSDRLVANWRMTTKTLRTVDETAIVLRSFFRLKEMDIHGVRDAVVCSVSPPATVAMVECLREHFDLDPLLIEPGIKTGMPIVSENPREVGGDRIVNGVAGLALYGPPLIIIDFGTATTFDCISAKGEFLGGVIAPGVMVAAEALYQRASKLPRIDLVKPKRALGRTTVESMQSGIYHGTLCMVEGMLAKLKDEMQCEPQTVATGGLASLIVPNTASIQHLEPNLTLLGLLRIHKRNR